MILRWGFGGDVKMIDINCYLQSCTKRPLKIEALKVLKTYGCPMQNTLSNHLSFEVSMIH